MGYITLRQEETVALPSEPMMRKLAAIVATDVVGYSRLMEIDEAGTLAAVKDRRKTILEPTLRSHAGRIVKVMGDGALIEFASAVNAVNAAVELQRKMAAANETIADDRHIVLRIGINLGEVLGEGSDIYGDGVNIAARLEGACEPGGICISGKVLDEISGKLGPGAEAGLTFEDMGEISLKNITRPIRAHLMRLEPHAPHPAGPAVRDHRPSVAVLPFANMSGDQEQEYFVDGMTEDIITELSRFRTLLVIARHSSFTFKGKAVDVRAAGQRLGARYVVEGSIRKAGSRLRVTAQLIDTETGNHVWSERYDRDLADVFAIQDELTAAIVGAVAGQVQAADISKARRRSTGSLGAYDSYLRGLELYNQTQMHAAKEQFERAIAADPDFAPAHAMLSQALLEIAMSYWAPEQRELYAATLDQSVAAGQRAIALDPNDAKGHMAVGAVYFLRKSFELAAYHHKTARELNPNDPDVIAAASYQEAFGDEPQKALELMDTARKLSPIQPFWYNEPRGIALYSLRRYAEAAQVFERASAKVPYSYRYLAACYAQLGETAKATAAVKKSLELQPDFTLAEWAKDEPYRSAEQLNHMLEGLRKAGLPE
jgi:adenylate cyclase